MHAAALPVLAQAAERSSLTECSEEVAFRATRIVEGLVFPWSIAFLADDRLLVVERAGRLRLVRGETDESPVAIQGLPPMTNLFDVVVAQGAADNATLYVSYSAASDGGIRLNVARAELTNERIDGLNVIFSSSVERFGMLHSGGRILTNADGALLVSVGDADDPVSAAQDLMSTLGKIVRIGSDGATAAVNAVIDGDTARPEVYAYGLRNVQGLVRDPLSGRVWATDHGPDGGADELNVVVRGANFGWPRKTDAAGGATSASNRASADAVKAPVATWMPAIAPSGLAMYRGRAFKQWEGNLFVGSLKQRHLRRLVIQGDAVVHEERLLAELHERIRDVREGPDGNLYVLTDSVKGSVVKIEPAHSAVCEGAIQRIRNGTSNGTRAQVRPRERLS